MKLVPATRDSTLATAIAAAAVVWFAVGCDGPIAMLPGGELSGVVKPVPESWQFSDAVEEVQLETRPSDPYSVNVWGVGIGRRFFIASSGGMRNAWAGHIAVDPRVRLRIGEDIFELRAVRNDDPLDRRRFLAGARNKYDGFEPDEDQAAEAVLFVLGPR